MWFSLIYRELPQIDAVDMISMCRCGGVAEPKLDFSYPPLCGVWPAHTPDSIKYSNKMVSKPFGGGFSTAGRCCVLQKRNLASP